MRSSNLVPPPKLDSQASRSGSSGHVVFVRCPEALRPVSLAPTPALPCHPDPALPCQAVQTVARHAFSRATAQYRYRIVFLKESSKRASDAASRISHLWLARAAAMWRGFAGGMKLMVARPPP